MAGCCGGDCQCGPCSGVSGLGQHQSAFGMTPIYAASPVLGPYDIGEVAGLGRMPHPSASALLHANPHARFRRGAAGLGQTTSFDLSSLQTELTTLWNDLQNTKIFGIGLGFIGVGVLVAYHFKKR